MASKFCLKSPGVDPAKRSALGESHQGLYTHPRLSFPRRYSFVREKQNRSSFAQLL